MSSRMKRWFRRIRGALGMGLIWGAGWGILVGGFMEAFVDPTGALVDIWPTALAIPGFLGGVVFSTVLGIVEGRRRFDELSLPRFGALGAAVGLLLGGLGVAAGVASALLPGVWLGAAVIIGLTTMLGAVSASGTLVLARTGEEPELLDGR